jgi:hypothetical protein
VADLSVEKRPRDRVAAVLKRFQEPRYYAGDYYKDFADRILADLEAGGYRIVADGPGRLPEREADSG